MTALLALDGVGKDYPKLASRGGRLRLVAQLLRGNAAPASFRALHDVTLSPAPVRERVFDELGRWLDAYVD